MKMKILPALILILAVSLVAYSQEETSELLNREERLELQGLRKDFELVAKDITITRQQLQMLQQRLGSLQQAQEEARQAFLGKVVELREQYDKPEERFNFNLDTMQFIPKPESETTEQEE